MIPDIINISEAKISDRRGADGFRYEKDTIIVDDRGYFETKLFKIRIANQNHFVTRIKDNIRFPSNKALVVFTEEFERFVVVITFIKRINGIVIQL